MITIGVTGGIASGKSTVSNILKKLGAEIIDADLISREVVTPGNDAYKKIVEEFGAIVLNRDSTINRQELGDIVFNSSHKLKKLEQITHPAIIKEQELRICALQKSNPDSVAVVDAALLIEAGFYKKVDVLVVVSAKEELQIERLFLRNSMTEEESKKRISAQMPISRKAELADYVIENNAGINELQYKVRVVFSQITVGLDL